MIFEKIGLQVPSILLPQQAVDMQQWAVIIDSPYLIIR